MIIAECCGNHGGHISTARDMIWAAKDAGASLVKFQLYDAMDDEGLPHYGYAKKAELSFDQAQTLFQWGVECGIEVFFSVFGVKYVEWCEKIGVKRYKIACGMRDAKVLQGISKTMKPVIISVSDKANYRGIMLYCVSEYPTPLDHIKMPNFEMEPYDGFSDHTIGLDASKIALARGATIIEKHFTFDKKAEGPDHFISMEPEELRELVRWEKVCKEVLS